MGTNHNEGSIFVPGMALVVPNVTLPITQAGLNRALLHFFNQTVVTEIMEIYPLDQYPSQEKRAGQILRDFFFVSEKQRRQDHPVEPRQADREQDPSQGQGSEHHLSARSEGIAVLPR